MNRTISATIPGLVLEKGAADPAWTQYRSGWQPFTGVYAPLLASYYETQIDLTGYALQDLVFYPELGFSQEGISRGMTGAEAAGMIESIIVSTVPQDPAYLLTQLSYGSGPGLDDPINFTATTAAANGVMTPVVWEQVPFCRQSFYVLNNTTVSSGGFMQLQDETQIGSLEPIAADRLFVYKIVYPIPTVTGGIAYTTCISPSLRVGFRGMMKEEADTEYLMRLKRGYELATNP